MAGERDLARLLALLQPEVRPGRFVFASIVPDTPVPGGVDPVVTVVEAEGTTLVVERRVAEAHGLDHDGAFAAAMITLRVHSALSAVGLTAAVTAALAAAGISANVVAGRFHDHVFVPEDRVDDALGVLRRLATGIEPSAAD